MDIRTLSGLVTVVADTVLVSPPEVTKRPRNIFEQFLRKPQDISVWDGNEWSNPDDLHVPGTASLIRWGGRSSSRKRLALFDLSATLFFTRSKSSAGSQGPRGRPGRPGVDGQELFLRRRAPAARTRRAQILGDGLPGPRGMRGLPGPPGPTGLRGRDVANAVVRPGRPLLSEKDHRATSP